MKNLIPGGGPRVVLPDDMETAGRIVEDICYNNAVRYFTKD